MNETAGGGAPLSAGAMGIGLHGPCSGDPARQVPVPIVGAISAGAMGISPLRVRSRSSFRGLSADCVADGLEERWRGGALSSGDVSSGEKGVIEAEVRRVMRS